MIAKIKKYGNSTYLQLSKQFLEFIEAKEGDSYRLTAHETGFNAEKVRKPRQGWFDALNDIDVEKAKELLPRDD